MLSGVFISVLYSPQIIICPVVCAVFVFVCQVSAFVFDCGCSGFVVVPAFLVKVVEIFIMSEFVFVVLHRSVSKVY